MDSHQIRVTALGRSGRSVKVGNFYNYYSDSILGCRVIVPQESISINKILPETAKWFHLPQSSHLKDELYEALCINTHLRISIDNKFVDLSQLWFADFLESSQAAAEVEDNNGAQVTFVFRACRQIEALCPKFIDSKLNEYQIATYGQVTHLVEQVIYGAEFICSLQRTIDRQHETKEKAEINLYLAAEEYFNQVFGLNNDSPDLPAALDNVQCQILSSLDPGNELEGSFQKSIQHLKDAMSFDNDDSHWRPVEITLRNIPEQMEARRRYEMKNDVIKRCNMRQATFDRIMDFGVAEFNDPLNHFKIFPQLHIVISQFSWLLGPLKQKIQRFHETLKTTTNPERNLEERQISNLLRDTLYWMFHLRSDMDKIFWLIEGTQLKILDLAKIEMLTATNKLNRAKVFVLRAEFYPSPLIESIYAYIGNPSAITAPLPVLPILLGDKRQLEKIREELQQFSAEAQSNSLLDQEELRHRYYIGITSEYPHLTDGTVTTFGDFMKENDSPMKQQQGTGIKQESRSFSGAEVNLSTGVCLSMEQRNNSILTSPESSADTEVVHYQSSKSPKMKQANQLKRLDEEGRRVEEEDTKSESLVDCMQAHCSIGDKLDENENCITEESVDDVGNQSVQYWNSTMSISHREFYHHEISIDMDCATETPPPDEIENDDQLNNQIIAEFFADEKNRCAELIKKGQPNVYLLNATDTSASEDLRWFDVGRPVRSPPTCMKNHKLIILMGATGCGKSTLINGMVNYILGVKWNDPFRFKCVRVMTKRLPGTRRIVKRVQ
ncbi:uncharacterized protein LOC124312878 isoform X2 [Daphnia pulicaria]|uniref:uncharacterized protein LOC124312878 isoform X2 n=1 Tax=Daphnia pulicaria TaxID=35523 RepID=UPI001EE9FA5B|nr:uncharacterized protein LOC124312878 isoform X2 [Daphnia pulicaria]